MPLPPGSDAADDLLAAEQPAALRAFRQRGDRPWQLRRIDLGNSDGSTLATSTDRPWQLAGFSAARRRCGSMITRQAPRKAAGRAAAGFAGFSGLRKGLFALRIDLGNFGAADGGIRRPSPRRSPSSALRGGRSRAAACAPSTGTLPFPRRRRLNTDSESWFAAARPGLGSIAEPTAAGARRLVVGAPRGARREIRRRRGARARPGRGTGGANGEGAWRDDNAWRNGGDCGGSTAASRGRGARGLSAERGCPVSIRACSPNRARCIDCDRTLVLAPGTISAPDRHGG